MKKPLILFMIAAAFLKCEPSLNKIAYDRYKGILDSINECHTKDSIEIIEQTFRYLFTDSLYNRGDNDTISNYIAINKKATGITVEKIMERLKDLTPRVKNYK